MRLLIPDFEINSGPARLNVRKFRTRLMLRSRSWSGCDSGISLNEVVQVPRSLRVAREIQACLAEAQAGNLNSPTQERSDS